MTSVLLVIACVDTFIGAFVAWAVIRYVIKERKDGNP
jgi:hypothetical protein